MKTMLIVDDETEICEFLKVFFEERGFQVHTANSGKQAMEKVASLRPRIMLLDIHMPGGDGLGVLKQVKAGYPETKVIMVTAIETNEKISEAMRLGADNFITKPLSLEYLEKDVNEKIAQLAEN
ncbi:MAG: response regulator [Candidatus Omnitrophota bacterium]